MQISMLVFTFFGFRPEILFLSKFAPKNYDPEFNGSVHFFCFRLEMLLLVQEIKIVSLRRFDTIKNLLMKFL